MNVLVTGANGLLGHHVVMELLKRQHSVHILVRSRKNIYFDTTGLRITEGNFTEHDCLTQAATGCDAIIHIAAVTATNLLHLEDYRPVNVTGTAQVIRVADELDIRRIVYISSANTIGFGNEHHPGDERLTIQYPFTESFYAQSKAESEQLMAQASGKSGRHVVILNPAFMLGAYDSKPSSGKLLLMGYKRRVMCIPRGGKNFVAAQDVAVAVCHALIMGRNGERYLASGVNLSFKEYYALQKQVGNYKQKMLVVPDFVLVGLGKAGDLIRRFGIRTELCTRNLRQLMIQEYYTNERAKKELNLPESGVEMAIKQAIDWFKEQNMV